jgi:hypothetical protein
MLEAVLVALLVLAFLMVAYKGAVHEFQILQKDWKPTIEWSALLAEQLPLVIRNVDPSWIGTWTYRATAAKSWPLQVRKDGKLFKTRWSEWIAAPPGQPQPTPHSLHEISAVASPPIALWEDGGFRRWSWIPAHLTKTQVQVLGPGAILPVRKSTAAATLLQATDGAPLQVWLAHEGAVPTQAVLLGRDPWSLTADTVPWISEVKFVEMRVRPGNALVIPTHWYWAARPQVDVGSAETIGEGSWFWTAEWQTPVSWLVSQIHR